MEDARRRTNQILLFIVAAVLASASATGSRSYLFQSAAERVMCSLRQRVFASIVAQAGWCMPVLDIFQRRPKLPKKAPKNSQGSQARI